jgi:hypothetical protein
MRLADAVGEGSRIGWNLTLYPDAREAAGVFRATSETWEGRRGAPGESRDPDRSMKVASSRARTAMRRFGAANRLNRLATLTYAGSGCHDPLDLRTHVGEFFERLRNLNGGRRFPYLWVPEWHKTDHGLHVHFALGQYIKRSLIEEAWGRGFVHIKLLGDLPVGSGALGESRKAARYLAKYVGKDFDAQRVPGLHRYEVAEGFQPRKEFVYGRTLEEAVGVASERMGSPPGHLTTSDQWEDWSGPSAAALTWPT